MTPDAPLRRTVLVVLIYLVCAALLLAVGGWLRRILALPVLFETLLHAGVWLGAIVAAVLAWNYPKLAVHGHEGPDAVEAGEP